MTSGAFAAGIGHARGGSFCARAAAFDRRAAGQRVTQVSKRSGNDRFLDRLAGRGARLSLAGVDIALHPLEVVFNVEGRCLFVAGDYRFVNQTMLRHIELDAIGIVYAIVAQAILQRLRHAR